MKYKEFEKHILRIQDAMDKEIAMSRLLKMDFLMEHTDNLMMSVCELLEAYFEDKSGWIGYWMWDLDFGKEYEPGMVKIDGRDVPLKTIEDLYNIL